MRKTISILIFVPGLSGDGLPAKVEVECIWKGKNLAVHKSYKKNQKPKQRIREYTITHIKTGMACGFLGRHRKATLYDLVAFAGKWDEKFNFSTKEEALHREFRDQYIKERFELTGYLI